MQFDLQRAFPYPVLRPGVDDYIDGDIQAIAEVRPEGDDITFRFDVTVSVKEIAQLVEIGLANYVAVVACRDTYIRRAAISSNPTFSESFPAGSLRGEVMIYNYIVASRQISGFKCAWLNPEFGDGPFSFPAGGVLAVDRPQKIYIDRETFKPIGSCFVLIKKDGLSDNEWRVNAENDKVVISVSPALKERMDAARNSKENRAILINSIYFGAVMQCLSLLKQDTDSEVENCRWAQIFLQRMADIGVKHADHNEVWLAQQLMRHPLSLLDQYVFKVRAE